ncbi:Arabinoxylan arabinofuranohydrolase precursor [compost metagenome]
MEAFNYNKDGSIPNIAMSKEGVKPVGTVDPYKKNEAEMMAWSEKCTTAENAETGVYVTQIRTGGYIKVRAVDFGDGGAESFSARLAAGLDGGILEVRLDSVAGTQVAAVQVPRTGGWNTWQTLAVPLSQTSLGIRDVYFVFKGQNITAGRELFNFDHWSFHEKK